MHCEHECEELGGTPGFVFIVVLFFGEQGLGCEEREA